jgi:hypothetical protein
MEAGTHLMESSPGMAQIAKTHLGRSVYTRNLKPCTEESQQRDLVIG